jgi:hypothetical protein
MQMEQSRVVARRMDCAVPSRREAASAVNSSLFRGWEGGSSCQAKELAMTKFKLAREGVFKKYPHPLFGFWKRL